MAVAWDLGVVGPQGATRYAMLAYDDIKSIQYCSNDLGAYWRRNVSRRGVKPEFLAISSLVVAIHEAPLRLTCDLQKIIFLVCHQQRINSNKRSNHYPI